jgi:hypothetical protein
MAFLNSMRMGILPGEWEAQGRAAGNDWQSRLGGLLSGDNALFNLGIGILANNNSNNLSEVLGRGVQQGLQQTQQVKQLGLQNKRLEAQERRFARQDRQLDMQEQAEQRRQAAIARAIEKNPQLADLYEINPTEAIKISYPQVSEAEPYYQPVYDSTRGLGSFNARTGKVEWNGGAPIVRPQDDPLLQGNIAGAKEAAQGNYKINTDIPGRVDTVTNIANEINGNPNMRIAPSVQKQRDDVRLQILLSEQQSEGGPGRNPELDKEIARMTGGRLQSRGIAVPTPEAQAALTEKAKADVGMGIDRVKNVKKADQFLSVANQAKSLLNSKENPPTASGIGAGVDALAGVVGYAPKGANEAATLDTLSGWMVANVPRMEGPQSNFDVQNYQTMAGMVGDRTKPLSVRKNALNEVIKLQEKYKSLNQDGNIMPKSEAMPPRVRKYNPKTGRIE